MGGVLPPPVEKATTPHFLITAMRDPDSAPLQRIQVIKGWMSDGDTYEQIYDVACSDGLKPDPANDRCPDNGAKVDLNNCSISRDKGDTELSVVWADPRFDATAPAFYYVRVLENPTCRWSTWDALRMGWELPADVPAVIQERAWTSPIWYQP